MSKQKLLLADDSITIQKVVNLTFADEGIEVISVGDGDSAMEKLAEVAPDLVMADINMPGLSGYEVCERIKQNDETRAIPVILLVGSFEPFDENEAKRVGADAFLTKPFQSIRQLVSKVSELLGADGKESDTESFIDTKEFEKESPEQFGETEMDDKMIRADAVDDYADDAGTQQAESDDVPVELDETNLLELPSRDYFLASIAGQTVPAEKTDAAAEAEAEVEAEVVDEVETEIEAEEASAEESGEIEESAVSGEPAEMPNLSPEMIDAIAAKVVEKISDKVIREIAWEVVPQMTDLIVKRMAEEKQEE